MEQMLKRNSDVRRFLSDPLFLLVFTAFNNLRFHDSHNKQLCWLHVIASNVANADLSGLAFVFLLAEIFSFLEPDWPARSRVSSLRVAVVPISLYSKYLFSIIVNICGNA